MIKPAMLQNARIPTAPLPAPISKPKTTPKMEKFFLFLHPRHAKKKRGG
jgi:hypothetical protein